MSGPGHEIPSRGDGRRAPWQPSSPGGPFSLVSGISCRARSRQSAAPWLRKWQRQRAGRKLAKFSLVLLLSAGAPPTRSTPSPASSQCRRSRRSPLSLRRPLGASYGLSARLPHPMSPPRQRAASGLLCASRAANAGRAPCAGRAGRGRSDHDALALTPSGSHIDGPESVE